LQNGTDQKTSVRGITREGQGGTFPREPNQYGGAK